MDWGAHLRLLIFFALMGALLGWVKGLTEENQRVFVAGSERMPALIEQLDRPYPDRSQVAQVMADPVWEPLLASHTIVKDDRGALILTVRPSESHARAGCLVFLGYLLDHPDQATLLDARFNGAPADTPERLRAYQCGPTTSEARAIPITTIALSAASGSM